MAATSPGDSDGSGQVVPVDVADQSALTKEKYRALEVFGGALRYWEIMTVAMLPRRILVSGFMAFMKSPIPNRAIPHEAYWQWNQCNRRVTVWVDGVRVSMRKVISRLSGSASLLQEKPQYKCWVIEFENVTGGELYGISELPKVPWHFIWCEKGVEEEYRLWEGALCQSPLSVAVDEREWNDPESE